VIVSNDSDMILFAQGISNKRFTSRGRGKKISSPSNSLSALSTMDSTCKSEIDENDNKSAFQANHSSDHASCALKAEPNDRQNRVVEVRTLGSSSNIDETNSSMIKNGGNLEAEPKKSRSEADLIFIHNIIDNKEFINELKKKFNLYDCRPVPCRCRHTGCYAEGEPGHIEFLVKLDRSFVTFNGRNIPVYFSAYDHYHKKKHKWSAHPNHPRY